MKKPPSKVAHNQPRPLFFSTGPAAKTAQKQPKNRNAVPPKAPYCRTGYLDWAQVPITKAVKPT